MDTNDFCYPLETLVLETSAPSFEQFQIASGICTSCGQANKQRSIECAVCSELWFFRQISRMELCENCFSSRLRTFIPTANKKTKRGYYDWPLPPDIADGYFPPRRVCVQEYD